MWVAQAAIPHERKRFVKLAVPLGREVAYRLDEVLLLALLAILAEAEGFTDIARFGHKKLALLRRFLPFHHGTPSHDHLGDIFAALDPVAFRRCFAAWAATLTQTPLEVIAIDGKTSRRSGLAGARDDPSSISSSLGLRLDQHQNAMTAAMARADAKLRASLS